ncbi:MAG: hypothetical protein GWP91_04470 [Rhodobacterales bacterium]|nr:hypothetical protein [Rhodobacterales bacterium]
MEHIAAIVCVVLTTMLGLAEYTKMMPLKVVSKTGAAAAFIVYALMRGAWEAGTPGQWVVIGLCLSMVGDICLLSQDKRTFLAGIGAFLLAHVAYVVAFLSLGITPTVGAAGLAGVSVIAAFVWRWLGPHTGTLKPAVAAYIVVITCMVAAAIGAAGFEVHWARTGLLVAAIAFFLSDLCVARERFIVQGIENKLIGLPLYFGAQLLFAFFISPAVLSA